MALQSPVVILDKDTLILSGSNGGVNSSGSAYGYGFEISARPDSGASWNMVTRVVTDATTFSADLTGLVPQGYEVSVTQYRLTKADGTYTYSSPISNIVTIPLPLRPPSTVIFDGVTNTLSWSGASGDIAGFDIYRDNGSSWSLLCPRIATTATSGSQVLDNYLTESADLMVVTVETDGRMSSASELKHVVIESSQVLSGYSLSFDEILISINTTVSLVSDGQEWVESLYSGTATLSEVFITIAEEDLLSGNTSGDLIADIQDYLESITSQTATQSLVVEAQTFVGKLEELIGTELDTSQIEDVQLYVDQLVSNNVTQSLAVDIREHVEGLLSVDITQSIEVDEQTFIGNVEDVLGIELSQSQVDDIQEYVESVASVNATLSLADSIQDYLESLISNNSTKTFVVETFFGIGTGHKRGSAYRISELPPKYQMSELPPKYAWKEWA